MFKRIYRYLRALIFGKLDQWENPEVILDEAVREMRDGQIKNRERAVQAITQKNNLQAMVDRDEKISRDLEAKAAIALQQGNRELARTILREKGQRDTSLEQLRASLKQAEETAEAIKVAIRHEDERIRVKTAEALRLKTDMKQAQIQIEINKALDGFQFEDNTQSFDRASERIQSMRSEADARLEVAKTSVNARLASIEDAQVDVEADKALQELEARLGLGQTAHTASNTTSTVTTPVQESDIDRQLRELEQKLNGQ
jgi:phage shock protein A